MYTKSQQEELDRCWSQYRELRLRGGDVTNLVSSLLDAWYLPVSLNSLEGTVALALARAVQAPDSYQGILPKDLAILVSYLWEVIQEYPGTSAGPGMM